MSSKRREAIIQTRWIDELRRAMQALDQLEIEDEGIRKTIWRALRSEYVEATDRFEVLETEKNDGNPWTEEDDQKIRAFFADRPVLKRWQEQRGMLVHLASELRRTEKSAKKRAEGLGFARYFDWQWQLQDD